MSRESASWWKYTATASVSALAVITTGYFAGAQDWITHDDAIRIVERQSPYVYDREAIRLQLHQNTAQISALTLQVRESAEIQAQLQAEVRNLVRAIDRKDGATE